MSVGGKHWGVSRAGGGLDPGSCSSQCVYILVSRLLGKAAADTSEVEGITAMHGAC